MNKELLKQLRESKEFQVVMADALKDGGRQIVPEFTPGKTMDETANNFEMIKFRAAQRTGWDALYFYLMGVRP